MAQSINTRADFVCNATAFTGFAHYGEIMVGDRGFEFFEDGNPNRNIQIPWTDVDYVAASVLFKGKWIPRIGIVTKKNQKMMFAAKEPRKLLNAIHKYIPADRMYRSWTFLEALRKKTAARFKKAS